MSPLHSYHRAAQTHSENQGSPVSDPLATNDRTSGEPQREPSGARVRVPSVIDSVRAERLDVPGERVGTRKVRAAVWTLLRHIPQVALGNMFPKARGEHVLVATPAPGTHAAVAVVGDGDVVVMPEVARDARGGGVFNGDGAAPVAPLTACTSGSGRLSSMSGGYVVAVRSDEGGVTRSIRDGRDGCGGYGVARRVCR